jgi:hypothetical protein
MNTDEIIETAIQGHASTRDALRWAIQQEREACAKLCIGLELPNGIEGLHPDSEEGMLFAAMKCCAAIRARGNE